MGTSGLIFQNKSGNIGLWEHRAQFSKLSVKKKSLEMWEHRADPLDSWHLHFSLLISATTSHLFSKVKLIKSGRTYPLNYLIKNTTEIQLSGTSLGKSSVNISHWSNMNGNICKTYQPIIDNNWMKTT